MNNEYIQEISGNKNLIFASTDKNKEVLTKYTEVWDKIKNLIEIINAKPGEYKKGFKRVKFDSDDNLPLNKLLKLDNLIIFVRPVIKKTTSIIYKLFQMNVFMSYKMLQYERIDISEGIDINKSNK